MYLGMYLNTYICMYARMIDSKFRVLTLERYSFYISPLYDFSTVIDSITVAKIQRNLTIHSKITSGFQKNTVEFNV